MPTEPQLASLSRGHGGHLPVDPLGQPAGGDGVAGPLDHTVHLYPGLLLAVQ